jgi:cytidylate kinase
MWAEGMVGGRLVDRTDFVRFLTRTIRAIHEHGGAVILGRGGNCILADTSTFRVHLTAPLDARISEVVHERACTEDEARAEISDVDAHRSAFIRKSFGARWSDPAYYDIVLNVSGLDDEAAVELIESCLRRFAARRWPHAIVGGQSATVTT